MQIFSVSSTLILPRIYHDRSLIMVLGSHTIYRYNFQTEHSTSSFTRTFQPLAFLDDADPPGGRSSMCTSNFMRYEGCRHTLIQTANTVDRCAAAYSRPRQIPCWHSDEKRLKAPGFCPWCERILLNRAMRFASRLPLGWESNSS